jgi:hypothetical protein
MMLLHIAAACSIAFGNLGTCPDLIWRDRGWTQKDYTYFAAATFQDCCSICAANASCVAWTFHVHSPASASCSIAPVATVQMGSGRISGNNAYPPKAPTPAPPPPAPPSPTPPPVPPHPPLGEQPNLVLFLQDDQDLALGGWTPMRQAHAVLNSKGATADNWFIHTPVCCPSRAELLSGRYFHNLREETPSGGCMHVDETKVFPVSVAQYLGRAGYTNGYFGKNLNQCPNKPPPGWDCPTCYWFANGGGKDVEPGGYLNATFNDYSQWPQSVNGTYRADTTGEFGGYTTAVIG